MGVCKGMHFCRSFILQVDRLQDPTCEIWNDIF